ncbi:MAG: DUF4160 domain-containing protein [Chloroflexi bacterium AL-W]|nr:DUF4160 domain-containing protein [Chloroflexi bacterium AL-N1]NOK71416.1 DUF4160 domain-containing protein [Chloroflexi bacterium AL-N10]NOK78819.1 DUF4160 domain-containing protein [Chloroflexi bacterium AL-N5]NOK86237.1 DUF4160 domain-containing protein [Chloroflexi bacterium AL-W]NOK93141.1 DUF4160 domain-containing protein [Chloroflexi bacterium AL-N15]
MPRISQFYGIIITMYYNDHAPPHFHASYAGDRAEYAISNGTILVGELPKRANRLVNEWAELRQAELFENWDLARQSLPLKDIDPLP